MAQTPPPLSLSDIVDISVTVAPTAASANSFNQGLFVGPSTVIPSYGANSRLRQYGAGSAAALSGMQTDGFTTTDPEYIAAQIYFSQPGTNYFWVGRQDLTALQTITIGTAGTGWVVGDQFDVVQSSASYGIGVVLAETGGVPSSVGLLPNNQGTGYSVATGLTTTAISPSVGTGLTVNVTAIGETLLQAATACRAASNTWYGLTVNAPVDVDNLALSSWADPLYQTTRYYPWSDDVGIPNGATNNLALQLQMLKLRVLGTYSTTQSGLYPNNAYAAVGVMGVEMGLNTGLANSFFFMAHKQIVGIAPEPLTQTQYTNIVNAGFNVYCNFSPYNLYEPGFMSNGSPSYLWLFLALLVANIQINVLNVLASNPAVPQTNAGEALLLAAVNSANALLASIGFLASNVWAGANIPIPSANNPGLTTGQALPSGYLALAAPYSQQSPSNRAAGQAMPIYDAVTTAGAVQSLLIGVYTQL